MAQVQRHALSAAMQSQRKPFLQRPADLEEQVLRQHSLHARQGCGLQGEKEEIAQIPHHE